MKSTGMLYAGHTQQKYVY